MLPTSGTSSTFCKYTKYPRLAKYQDKLRRPIPPTITGIAKELCFHPLSVISSPGTTTITCCPVEGLAYTRSRWALSPIRRLLPGPSIKSEQCASNFFCGYREIMMLLFIRRSPFLSTQCQYRRIIYRHNHTPVRDKSKNSRPAPERPIGTFYYPRYHNTIRPFPYREEV